MKSCSGCGVKETFPFLYMTYENEFYNANDGSNFISYLYFLKVILDCVFDIFYDIIRMILEVFL